MEEPFSVELFLVSATVGYHQRGQSVIRETEWRLVRAEDEAEARRKVDKYFRDKDSFEQSVVATNIRVHGTL